MTSIAATFILLWASSLNKQPSNDPIINLHVTDKTAIEMDKYTGPSNVGVDICAWTLQRSPSFDYRGVTFSRKFCHVVGFADAGCGSCYSAKNAGTVSNLKFASYKFDEKFVKKLKVYWTYSGPGSSNKVIKFDYSSAATIVSQVSILLLVSTAIFSAAINY